MKRTKRPSTAEGSNIIPDDIAHLLEANAGRGIATAAHDVSLVENDFTDPLNDGLAFDLPFLEKVLLALIDAHPIEPARKGVPRTREGRLNLAMRTLTGSDRSEISLPDDPDEKALLWMASEALRVLAKRNKGGPGRLPDVYVSVGDPRWPSKYSLADKAADKFFPSETAEEHMAAQKRLSEKFSGTYAAKIQRKKSAKKKRTGSTTQPSSGPPDIRRTLLFRTREHDHVVESIEAQLMRQLKAIFDRTKVKFNWPAA